MKYRFYRRRGGGISGGVYKRRVWKQIMKLRGEFVLQKSWSSKGKRGGGGGGGKFGLCFKCGEEGYWVKNCRRFKKQSFMVGKNFDSRYVICVFIRCVLLDFYLFCVTYCNQFIKVYQGNLYY